MGKKRAVHVLNIQPAFSALRGGRGATCSSYFVHYRVTKCKYGSEYLAIVSGVDALDAYHNAKKELSGVRRITRNRRSIS